MGTDATIEQLVSVEAYIHQLSDLLRQLVEQDASIGFLPPLSEGDSMNYWRSVVSPEVILLIAKIDNRVVGTVQLQLTLKPNGNHRAEIAKLMTHPAHQRQGIARLLMQKAEALAREYDRSLLVLDTREGDPSNTLYLSLGYIQAGRIPMYAKSATGALDATNIYYKVLNPAK